jgi:transcription elongation factor GreA
MAEIIDPRKLAEPQKVVFGVSVKIEDVNSGESRGLTIVGADESDVDQGWISIESPLGRGLIGKELGDVARVQLPAGIREYEILEIFIDYVETTEGND